MIGCDEAGGVLDPSKHQLNLGGGATAQGMANALRLTGGLSACSKKKPKTKGKASQDGKSKAKEVGHEDNATYTLMTLRLRFYVSLAGGAGQPAEPGEDLADLCAQGQECLQVLSAACHVVVRWK